MGAWQERWKHGATTRPAVASRGLPMSALWDDLTGPVDEPGPPVPFTEPWRDDYRTARAWPPMGSRRVSPGWSPRRRHDSGAPTGVITAAQPLIGNTRRQHRVPVLLPIRRVGDQHRGLEPGDRRRAHRHGSRTAHRDRLFQRRRQARAHARPGYLLPDRGTR